MTFAKPWISKLTWLAAMCLAISFATFAQEDASSKPTGQDQGDKPAPAPQTADNPPVPAAPTPAYPVDSTIRAAGRATPWVGSLTPLRWGPFSIAGFEYVNIYDQFIPSNGSPNITERLNMIRMNIVFDKTLGKSRFVFQYTPVLAMANGQVRGNATPTGDLSLGTTFAITPRLTFTLKDDFGVHRSRQLFPSDLPLLIDNQTGGVVQSYLLEPSGTLLRNTLVAIVDYKLSPRLTLDFSPTYVYAHIDNTFNNVRDLFILDDFFNTLSLTYAVSPRINMGVVESVEFLHPVVPVATNGLFQTSGMFYSERFTPSFSITGKFGIQGAQEPGFGGTTWSWSGSFSALKTFGNSDLALAYFRGTTLTNFINNNQAERADVSYGYRFSRLFTWNNAAGYYRTTGSGPRDLGKYASTTLAYHLPAGFSLSGSYTHFYQKTTNVLLLSGERNTFVLGLRWEPGPAPGRQ
jgi:hypothetical protein